MLLVMMLLLVNPATQAHRLGLFAYVDGARIEGKVYFVGGGSAEARITVEDDEGRILARPGMTRDGSFAHVAETAVDHIIVADTGDGHRAQWRISAAELAAGLAGRNMGASATRIEAIDAVGETRTAQEDHRFVDEAELRSMIESAVMRQIRPLREELILTRESLQFSDILGGIGYVFGLAGLALWWKHGRPKGRH